MSRIANEIDSLDKKLDILKRMTFQTYQGWNWLKSIKVGEVIKFSNGVISEKVEHSTYFLKFKVTIPPNTVFPEHWHDCDEMISVVEGTIYEDELGINIGKGQNCFIPKKTPHAPRSGGSTATVIDIMFVQ